MELNKLTIVDQTEAQIIIKALRKYPQGKELEYFSDLIEKNETDHDDRETVKKILKLFWNTETLDPEIERAINKGTFF